MTASAGTNTRRSRSHIDHYHNIGDAFVFDSSLKLLNYDKLDVLDIRNVKPGDVERYNAEYDYVFLRGSNYIHSHMDWENAEQVLPKLKIPDPRLRRRRPGPQGRQAPAFRAEQADLENHRRQVGLARRARHLYR